MAKSAEQVGKKMARNSLMAYLAGEQTLNWVIGEIRYSGVRGQALAEIFDALKKTYGEQDRYETIYSACQDRGWL